MKEEIYVTERERVLIDELKKYIEFMDVIRKELVTNHQISNAQNMSIWQKQMEINLIKDSKGFYLLSL